MSSSFNAEADDADFLDVTHGDRTRARALRKQLQQISKNSPSDVLREMAVEVLSGRMGIRDAISHPAYSDAVNDQVRTFRDGWDRSSPAERAAHEESARGFLEAQRVEIEEERLGGVKGWRF